MTLRNVIGGVLLAWCFAGATVCPAQNLNWDPYAPTTHSMTLPAGDYVEVTVQGLSHILMINEGTWWDYSRWPFVKISAVTVWGHYSNKREPYVITGQVIPGSGPEGGWFRVNSLNIYTYHRCDGEQPWMNYVSTNALPIWKPEQSGELIVTGSGNYLPDCPVHHELTKLEFRGSDGSGVVREIYIDLKGGRPLPPAPPDEPDDPDYVFKLEYDERETGPPGEDWPPFEDDVPPYNGGDGDSGDLPLRGGGTGVCSPFGLPIYRVDASDLSLNVTDRMFAYASLGPDPAYIHTHRSRKAADGMFGSRWFFSYEQKVVPVFPARVRRGHLTLDMWVSPVVTPPVARVHLGDGIPLSFSYTGTNALGEKVYAPQDPFLKAELVLLPDAWELRRSKPRWTHRFERVASYTSYPLGRLSSISDAFDNQMLFTYESNSNGSQRSFWLIRDITDAAGRTTHFEYTNGLCSRVTMPNGLFAAYGYDTNACLVETTDLLGNVTTYTYGDSLQTLDRMESAGKTVQFLYDNKRRLARVINPLGHTNIYQMVSSNETRFTSAAGYTRTTSLSDDGLPVGQSNSAGQSASMSYVEGRPTQVIRTAGRYATVSYDSAGNRTRHENPAGAVTTRAFDEKNRLAAVTNALGQVTRFTYGPRDELIDLTRPSGARLSFEYLANGLLSAFTNELGHVTRQEYDSFGNLSRTIDPTGGVTRYEYDAAGLAVTHIVNPNGHATAYAYDENGRVTEIRFADATTQTFHYDCCALIGVTDAFGHFHPVERDNNLYLTNLTASSGVGTSLSYDEDGRQSAISNSTGHAWAAAFDDIGRPRNVVTPGGTLGFGYDEMWNITHITNPAGAVWQFMYDQAKHLTAETDPLGLTTHYTRDALGRLLSVTNPDGSTVTQTYTADGYEAALTVEAGGMYSNEYNLAGWITAQHTPHGGTYRQYDAAGRVTRIDYPGGLHVEKSYDANGNLVELIYPNGVVASYAYDARERITDVLWDGGGVGFGYDDGSRLSAITRANRVDTHFERTLAGRVTNLTHTTASGLLARIVLTRDALGRITQSAIDSDVLPVPDVLSEPSASMGYNRADGMVALAGASVDGDPRGNITAIHALGGAYAYDALNRVQSITAVEGTTQLAYDALSRVIRIQTPAKTRRFFYDERSRLLFATDDAFALVWINLFAGEMLIARDTSGHDPLYYHYSDLGHTLALTDSAGGVTAAFAYTPFGMSTQAFATDREWFTLSGSFAVLDLGHGHHHMRHRLYHAGLGRFLQRDPIGMAGGANSFAYAGSNPVNAMDPFGLSDWLYDEMNSLREEYNNQKEIEKRREYARIQMRVWEMQRKEDEQWEKDNPIKAWALDQLLSKTLAFSTGGFSELAVAYDKYQRGDYAGMVLDPILGLVPGLGETKSLLDNLYRTYPPDRRPLRAPDYDWHNLGGSGGPQCMMGTTLFK